MCVTLMRVNTGTQTIHQLWAPFSVNGRPVMSFRTLDERRGVAKGDSFRRFKARLALLQEGRDFWRLEATADAVLIAELKDRGLVYRNSVNVVLLDRSAVAAMVDC